MAHAADMEAKAKELQSRLELLRPLMQAAKADPRRIEENRKFTQVAFAMQKEIEMLKELELDEMEKFSREHPGTPYPDDKKLTIEYLNHKFRGREEFRVLAAHRPSLFQAALLGQLPSNPTDNSDISQVLRIHMQSDSTNLKSRLENFLRGKIEEGMSHVPQTAVQPQQNQQQATPPSSPFVVPDGSNDFLSGVLNEVNQRFEQGRAAAEHLQDDDVDDSGIHVVSEN